LSPPKKSDASRLESVKGDYREILRRCQSGESPGSCVAFADLLRGLLALTVLGTHATFPPLQRVPAHKGTAPAGAFAIGQPGLSLPLNNGWRLRLLYTVIVEPSESANGARKLKTLQSSVQYQRTESDDTFVFRYDYLRYSTDDHPPGHVQIRGTPAEDCLSGKQLLERIHFPTGRITIEAIIRLLIVQFNLTANEPEIWQPILHLTETEFLRIGRHLPSGRRGDEGAR
jgi:hypothetical protein